VTVSPTFSREYEPDKNYNATLHYQKGENQAVTLWASEGMIEITAQAMHQMMQQLGYKLVTEERHSA